MTANRVAAAGGVVAAVAAAAVSVLGAVDSTAKALVLSVALVCVAAVVVVFLLGSQKWDRIKAGVDFAKAKLTPAPVVLSTSSGTAGNVTFTGNTLVPTAGTTAPSATTDAARDTEVGAPDPSAARDDLDSTVA